MLFLLKNKTLLELETFFDTGKLLHSSENGNQLYEDLLFRAVSLMNSSGGILYLKQSESQNLFKNLELNILQKIKENSLNLKSIIRLLSSNSINNNLKKGYVILQKYKKIIKRANQLSKKDDIQIKFYDKKIDVKIKQY